MLCMSEGGLHMVTFRRHKRINQACLSMNTNSSRQSNTDLQPEIPFTLRSNTDGDDDDAAGNGKSDLL